MSVSRVGSWSTPSNSDPATITAGAGDDRALVVVMLGESTAGDWSPDITAIGGVAPHFTQGYTFDVGATSLHIKFFVWNEEDIAAFANSTVTYSHVGTETGQAWSYATFQDVLDQVTPAVVFQKSTLNRDDLTVETSSFSDGYIIVAGARSENAREFTAWDTLTEQFEEHGSQGFRYGLADGSGGETETTVTGDATADDMMLVSLVLSGTVNDNLFTGNGAISMGETHRDNLDSINSAFDGRLSYSGGQWTVRTSTWVASSLSLTESDIQKGSLKIRGSAPESDRFNRVRGHFIDPVRDYQPAEFPHRTRAAYLARDNEKVLERELLLPMTNNSRMAQRLAYRLLDQGNNQIIVECVLSPRAIQIRIGDVVDLTLAELSWTAKTFRVIEWRPRPDATFAVVLREDSEDDYQNPLASEYGDATEESVEAPEFIVPPPTNLSAVSIPFGIRVSWTLPMSLTYDLIDVYASDSSAWANAVLIASVRSSYFEHQLDEGESRYYWVIARKYSGQESTRLPDSDTSTITASANNTVGVTFGSLGNKTLFNSVSDPADANCGIRIDSDGFIYTRQGLGAWVQREKWIGDGVNTEYESRMTNNSGDALTTGTAGSWLGQGSDRTYETLQSTVGGKANSHTLEIRRTSDNTVGLSATITHEVEVE